MYSNKLFKEWIKNNCKVDSEKLYKIYQKVRSEKKEKDKAIIFEEEKLINFLKEELKKLETIIRQNGKYKKEVSKRNKFIKQTNRITSREKENCRRKWKRRTCKLL